MLHSVALPYVEHGHHDDHVPVTARVRHCLYFSIAPCCCHVRRQGGGAGGYSLLPDYSAYQPASPPGPHSRVSSASDGSDSPYAHSSSSGGSHSPTASSSGSRTARSSCCGDGVVEIALVLRAPSAEGENGEGARGQGGSSKAVGKEGQELL
jgi:hypothetical protein